MFLTTFFESCSQEEEIPGISVDAECLQDCLSALCIDSYSTLCDQRKAKRTSTSANADAGQVAKVKGRGATTPPTSRREGYDAHSKIQRASRGQQKDSKLTS